MNVHKNLTFSGNIKCYDSIFQRMIDVWAAKKCHLFLLSIECYIKLFFVNVYQWVTILSGILMMMKCCCLHLSFLAPAALSSSAVSQGKFKNPCGSSIHED